MDSTSSLPIDFSLAVNEVGRDVDQVEYSVDGLVPVPQQVVLVLDRPEVDHPIDPVDPALYGFVVVEGTQLLLTVFLLHLQELAQPVQCQLAVVLANDSDVVLDQHTLELADMVLTRPRGTSWWRNELRNSWKESLL